MNGQFCAIGNPQHRVLKVVRYEGTDAIYEGMPLAYNHDTTTNVSGANAAVTAEGSQNEGKHYFVEKLSTTNYRAFAGVVDGPAYNGLTGPREIVIAVPNGAIVPVRCYANITRDDAMYLVPGQYYCGNTYYEGAYIGRAVETIDRSSTAGLCFIQLVPNVGIAPYPAIAAKATAYTVVAADSGKVFSNAGASGSVTFTLPSAPAAGLRYTFIVQAAQNLVLDPGTNDKLIFGNEADVLADNESLTITPADANDTGLSITIQSNSDANWDVLQFSGAAAKFVIP